MSAGWIAIAVIGVATMLIKATGPVILGGRELPPRVLDVVTLLAPALLAALVATQVFGFGRSLVLDERVLGLSVALVALALRAPVLVVVVVAAAATATFRLIA
ncbi:MAG TPA: AzlD domain-containing protein [Actinomycetota bacterium]|nr:AzlD domain-containing protein [Actinomycetota bacterium]